MSLSFLHSPADVIRWLLISLGLGTDPLANNLWPIVVDDEPELPDNVLTIYDTTARDDGRAMIDGESWHHMGFQVRIRSRDFTAGYVKADAIQVALDEQVYQNTVSIGTARYLVDCITGTTLIRLGKELPASKRSLFTINALAPIIRTS